jgi:hypothetical protein
MSTAPVVPSLTDADGLGLGNRTVEAAFERKAGRQLFLHADLPSDRQEV